MWVGRRQGAKSAKPRFHWSEWASITDVGMLYIHLGIQYILYIVYIPYVVYSIL